MYFCPRPTHWARIHKQLLRIHAKLDGQPEPPTPLILNGWVFSSAAEKHTRWQETLDWARRFGASDVTDSVPADGFEKWEHESPGWTPG